jgi:hypothetical protein
MTHEIAKVLAGSLRPLYNQELISVLVGLVKLVTQDRDNRTIRFPIPYDFDAAAVQMENVDVIPDQKHRAIVYFEGDSSDLTSFEPKSSRARTDLRLVCWYNSMAYQVPDGNRETIHAVLVSQILTHLKAARPTQNGIVAAFKIEPTRIYDSAQSLFTKYSYHQTRGQYLQSPYFAFGIDVTVTYQINHGCTTTLIAVEPDNCC